MWSLRGKPRLRENTTPIERLLPHNTWERPRLKEKTTSRWKTHGVSLAMGEGIQVSKTLPQHSRAGPWLVDQSTICEDGLGVPLAMGTLGRFGVAIAQYTTSKWTGLGEPHGLGGWYWRLLRNFRRRLCLGRIMPHPSRATIQLVVSFKALEYWMRSYVRVKFDFLFKSQTKWVVFWVFHGLSIHWL